MNSVGAIRLSSRFEIRTALVVRDRDAIALGAAERDLPHVPCVDSVGEDGDGADVTFGQTFATTLVAASIVSVTVTSHSRGVAAPSVCRSVPLRARVDRLNDLRPQRAERVHSLGSANHAENLTVDGPMEVEKRLATRVRRQASRDRVRLIVRRRQQVKVPWHLRLRLSRRRRQRTSGDEPG
jgi:hypothetical protein